jgi:FAD/FMN-containing dehydrogenase
LKSDSDNHQVQCGGHSTNPGFSSTKGIHISLNNFNTVQYDATSKTAEFGAGLRWDDVYAALEPHGVSVLGGRVAGVGVGGFTLGGGYAWRTNQYLLTIDTATAFELVKPNGDVVKVTEKSDPSLFFALRVSLTP